MKKIFTLATVVISLFISTQSTFAQVIPFQGRLLENGEPVNDQVNLIFSFDSLGWSETHTGIAVSEGLYSVELGSIISLPSSLFYGVDHRMLSIQVNGTDMTPLKIYPAFTGNESFINVGTDSMDRTGFSSIIEGTGNLASEYTGAKIIARAVMGGGTFTYGTEITIKASQNPGFTFDGWKEKGIISNTNQVYTFVVNKDRDLTAIVDPANAGSVSVSNEGLFFPGDLASLSTRPNTGYQFINWTLGATGPQVSVNPEYRFTINEDRELQAHYTELEKFNLNIEVIPEGAATVTGAGEYSKGTSASIGVTPNEGYSFKYWSKGTELISKLAETALTIQGNLNLTAYLTLSTYKILYAAEANGKIAGEKISIFLEPMTEALTC